MVMMENISSLTVPLKSATTAAEKRSVIREKRDI